jgi:hypothetical protein
MRADERWAKLASLGRRMIRHDSVDEGATLALERTENAPPRQQRPIGRSPGRWLLNSVSPSKSEEL